MPQSSKLDARIAYPSYSQCNPRWWCEQPALLCAASDLFRPNARPLTLLAIDPAGIRIDELAHQGIQVRKISSAPRFLDQETLFEAFWVNLCGISTGGDFAERICVIVKGNPKVTYTVRV